MEVTDKLIVIVCVLIMGCSQSGPVLVPVTGVVKLDGQPLPKARVVFQPSGTNASPSVGHSAENGSFELAFNRQRKGAIVGKHKVSVTTSAVRQNESGQDVLVPERIPQQYNNLTELKYEVKNSSNHFDIDLTSAGVIVQPDQSDGTATTHSVSCPGNGCP